MLTETTTPQILALDFDGVLCDGLAEYFQSSKRAYGEIWGNPDVTDQYEPAFRRLRPIIETGWEMPVLLRALVLEVPEANILADWGGVSRQIIQKENLSTQQLSHSLDQVRDRWIASDLESWLELQRFYPGVVERIQTILQQDTHLYIISTKEGRFIRSLLEQGGVEIPPESIIGKESKQPKYQTITQLLDKHNYQSEQVWFVEDRLDALLLVEQQPHLQRVGLFLADWGYNTATMRSSIQDNPNIKLLSLEQFQQDFSTWM